MRIAKGLAVLVILAFAAASANAAATSSRAQQAPMGMPLPRALAIATMSGRTSSPCSNPNQRPVRPRPDWISSSMSSTRFSRQTAAAAYAAKKYRNALRELAK